MTANPNSALENARDLFGSNAQELRLPPREIGVQWYVMSGEEENNTWVKSRGDKGTGYENDRQV